MAMLGTRHDAASAWNICKAVAVGIDIGEAIVKTFTGVVLSLKELDHAGLPVPGQGELHRR